MRKQLALVKERFVKSMKAAAKIIGVSPSELKRDDYVRATVDNKIPEKLNKELLNAIGGFKSARDEFFPKPEVITKPSIVFFDIETAPVLAHVWGLWDQSVGLNMIERDWFILSWAAKWADSDEIMYMDQRNANNIEDDKKLLKGIWEILDKADVVVGQNSKRFDRKKLNARFILNGMKPPSSYRQVDTLVIAKKHFAFTSNKLAYMTDKLCDDFKKITHSKYPGFELWKECLKGNQDAFLSMEEYNIADITSLEELYKKLIPWDNSINFSAYSEDLTQSCSCGHQEFKKNGFYFTNTAKYQKRTCVNCGAEFRDSDNLLSKEKRQSLLKPTSRVR